MFRWLLSIFVSAVGYLTSLDASGQDFWLLVLLFIIGLPTIPIAFRLYKSACSFAFKFIKLTFPKEPPVIVDCYGTPPDNSQNTSEKKRYFPSASQRPKKRSPLW